MQIARKETELSAAVKVLQEALKSDPELFYCYQSNIACAIMDEFKELPLSGMNYHKFANDSAKRVLNLFMS